ncbi:MAG TPA: LLM class flavin-dependent oxidoreductase, partial [Dehalococcoidia bacterium]|nr:LLM class flavin-dependent oxidoreductase [Dehalococcoidia bacterium]
DDAAAEVGYTPGPENRGYLIRCHVAETEEKALQNARQFMWMQGEFTGLAHPVWANPSGYFSPQHRRTFVETAIGRRPNPAIDTFEAQIEKMSIIAGTPDQVVEKLRVVLEETRPSIMALWGNDGKVSHEDAMTCIRLLGQEVMPRLREIGRGLGLNDPFEAQAPISLQFPEPAYVSTEPLAQRSGTAAD